MTTPATVPRPLVSCLCITEDRPAFMPWLLWSYDRQTWRERELVIIDSSIAPLVVDREDVRVIHVPHRTGVARKRNLALEHARGDIVAWLDDDDWQHPERLERLARALGDGKPYAGATEGWFLDLETLRCRRFRGAGQSVLFNGAGFRTDAVRRVPFPVHLARASDTSWMTALRQRLRTGGKVVDGPLFFWLCHGANLSNPARKHRFTDGIASLRGCVGADAWGDTDGALAALRGRLELADSGASAGRGEATEPPRQVGSRASLVQTAEPSPFGADPAGPSPVGTPPEVPVTAIVKATVQDAAYLEVMVPHMLRQARYDFRERIVAVDPRRAFSGKYRARESGSEQALERALDGLLARGEIDRVLQVPDDADSVAAVNRAWFGRPDVPTHATSGGPIYPTLWALEQAPSDHVLQFDADILFYTDGDSWVARALACMARDPRCWLAMTHAGPPVGPPGRSLAGANLRRARWDAALGVWRFRTASTRFFLTDRRRLRGRLPALVNAQGCLPLEQCISRALALHQAFRADIGNCRSWHLHVYNHAEPFPGWAPRLVDAVARGCHPALQAGVYDLTLERPRDRAAWQAILFPAAQQSMPASTAAAVPPRPKAPSVRAAGAESASIPTRTVIAGRAVPRQSTVDPAPSPTADPDPAPIQVIIPVRDRAAERLRATLASLAWQDRPAARTLVVSHGSSAATDAALAALCRAQGVGFERIARPADPWCKPAALNHGIRQTPPELPYVMTLDADMILAPDFIGVVAAELARAPAPGAMVLCRSRDLPSTARIPAEPRALRARFAELCRGARLRGRQACGGIQAAPRDFFFAVRGYDEAFTWWGEEDRDMVARAEGHGLAPVWIEARTAMLHQWHPHATASRDPRRREMLLQALAQNRALRHARAGVLVRDNPGW